MSDLPSAPDPSSVPPKEIPGKQYMGRVTNNKCVEGFIHTITMDIYCCPFEEVIVSDIKTEETC